MVVRAVSRRVLILALLEGALAGVPEELCELTRHLLRSAEVDLRVVVLSRCTSMATPTVATASASGVVRLGTRPASIASLE